MVKINKKQYLVSEGDLVAVDRIPGKNGKIVLEPVLLVAGNNQVLIGRPNLSKAKVEAEVLEEVRAPKIRVTKFRPKSRYKRVMGHRQRLTLVKIEKIIIAN